MSIQKIINHRLFAKSVVAVAALVAAAGTLYFSDPTLYKASLLQNPVASTKQVALGASVTCAGYPNPAPFISDSKVWWFAEVTGVPNPSAVSYKWTGDESLDTAYSYDTSIQKVYTSSGTKHATVTANMAELGVKTASCSVIVSQPNVPYKSPYYPLTCKVSPAEPYIGEIVTWSATVGNVTDATALKYTWTGAVTGEGQSKGNEYSAEGVKTAYVSIDDFEIGQQIAKCTVTVKAIEGYSPDTTEVDTSVPADTSSTSTSSTTTSSSGETLPPAGPAPDIMSCKISAPELVLADKNPIRVDCFLSADGFVTAQVVQGDYKPPEEPAQDTVAKTLLYNAIKLKNQNFYIFWNGINDFDSNAEEGDYAFAISAKQTRTAPADYSIQKFKVIAEKPPVETQETSESQQTAGTGQTGQVAPASAATTESTPASASPATPPPPPEPSKCPGVNYPSDIAGHWAEEQIKKGFDACMFKGYADGTFHPDSSASRAEGVKMALAAAGIPPIAGCFDNDCGSPFTDLDSWQGAWLRAAYDLHLIEGTSETTFEPNRMLTRAEAASLIAKVFKIPPHMGCYTTNCGAGHPDNLFEDIVAFWQGPWIRALWDRGLIKGTAPHQFAPDRAITRAELAKLIISAKGG